MATPSYKSNDPKGWCGDPARGAAMGRGSLLGVPEGRMVLRRVRLDSGGYDSNGTYFGHADPLFWYADEGGNVDAMLRAKSRAEAKAKILSEIPDAKFFRG